MTTEQLWAYAQAANRVATAARLRYDQIEAGGHGGEALANAQSELADADMVEEALYSAYQKSLA